MREPGFDILQTVKEGGWRKSGTRFAGEIELSVVRVAVKIEAVIPEDIAKGE